MKLLVRLLILLLLTALIGCTNTPNSPSDDQLLPPGETSFFFVKPANLAHLIASAEAIISAPDMDSIVTQLTVTDTTVYGTVDQIPAGDSRKFEILVYDENDDLTYEGSAFADVPGGATITVNITLLPVSSPFGTAIIVGTFGPGPDLNYSLSFDGQNDWVSIGDRDELEFGTSDFTLSAWIKTEKRDVQQQIIRKGLNNRTSGEGRWVLKVHSNNRVKIVLDDVYNSPGSGYDVEGNIDVADGFWHHVAAVFDRDQSVRIYVDGQLDVEHSGLIAHSGPIENSLAIPVLIGCGADNNLNFDGLLDEIRVWNTARTQQQILSDKNQPLSGNEPGLIAYWNMNEGEGQVLVDHAGANDGILGSTTGTDENDPVWEQTDFPD